MHALQVLLQSIGGNCGPRCGRVNGSRLLVRRRRSGRKRLLRSNLSDTLVDRRRPVRLGPRLFGGCPGPLHRLLRSRLSIGILVRPLLGGRILSLQTRQRRRARDSGGGISCLDVRSRLLSRFNNGGLWRRRRSPLGAGGRYGRSRADTVDRGGIRLSEMSLRCGRGIEGCRATRRRKVLLVVIQMRIRIIGIVGFAALSGRRSWGNSLKATVLILGRIRQWLWHVPPSFGQGCGLGLPSIAGPQSGRVF